MEHTDRRSTPSQTAIDAGLPRAFNHLSHGHRAGLPCHTDQYSTLCRSVRCESLNVNGLRMCESNDHIISQLKTAQVRPSPLLPLRGASAMESPPRFQGCNIFLEKLIHQISYWCASPFCNALQTFSHRAVEVDRQVQFRAFPIKFPANRIGKIVLPFHIIPSDTISFRSSWLCAQKSS